MVYIDICNNLKMFSILEETKEKKKKINNPKLKRVINFFLLLKYRIYMLLHIKKKINFENNTFFIIYTNNFRNVEKIINSINVKEKNIVISKQLKKLIKNQIYKETKSKSIYIENIEKVVKFVIEKQNSKVEENNIYFLIKNNNYKFSNTIINFSIIFKNLSIITNNINQFKFIQNDILMRYGIHIIISNNRKKSLLKAKYIINVDNSEKDISKYNISRDSVIFNLSDFSIKSIRGFDGIIINDITWKVSKKYEKNKYIYSRFDNYMEKPIKTKEIDKMIGNNGFIYIK